MGRLNIIDTDSSGSYDSPMDYNPDASNVLERTQNTLFNGAKAVKDSVENGSIEITSAEETIYENGVMPDVDTSRETFTEFTGKIGDYWVGEAQDKVKDGQDYLDKSVENVTRTVEDSTSLLPDDIGDKLGIVLWVIIAGVGIYILTLLQPILKSIAGVIGIIEGE